MTLLLTKLTGNNYGLMRSASDFKSPLFSYGQMRPCYGPPQFDDACVLGLSLFTCFFFWLVLLRSAREVYRDLSLRIIFFFNFNIKIW